MISTPWVSAASLFAVAFWSASVLGQGSQARPPVGYVAQNVPSPVRLEVVAGGSPMQTVDHRGKTYLPVADLGEYVLRVRNRGGRRVLAVLSVDGLNVMNGRPDSLSSAGYLIDPNETVSISGWRRSLGTVAAFRFTAREDSYAARMGQADNVGQIRLTVYEERRQRAQPRPPLRPTPRPLTGRLPSPTTAPRPGGGPARASSAPAGPVPSVGGTGTAYGRDLASSVVMVRFERGQVVQTMTLYYDLVETLRKAGVLAQPPQTRRTLPRPPMRPVRRPQVQEFAPPPPSER